MGKTTYPQPVKLFVGMLSEEIPLFEELKERLATAFGDTDMESPVWTWSHTDYYTREMGKDLERKFIFFERLIKPGEISGVKLGTIELERQYRNDKGGRRINLDPGYLDSARIVLASSKDFSHRIYLDKGIYAEVTLIHSGGDYRSLPYTFPDFRTERYLEVFRAAREIYKKQAK